MDYALYIASAAGALALFLMMPRRGFNPRLIGALIGAMALGGLWLTLARFIPTAGGTDLGLPRSAMLYYYVFSALAIGSAVRVITHTKPVYSALWFVMVVLASGGLFLLVDSEFMAFAMVIIYGGAILVTYVFVIMLASQAESPDRVGETDAATEYDRLAREPLAAIAAGFVLLAVLLQVVFRPIGANPDMAGPTDQQVITHTLTNRPAQRLVDRFGAQAADADLVNPDRLDNVERVGLDLFRSHPLGLELAGVILTVSLVGAVIIARKRVEHETA